MQITENAPLLPGACYITGRNDGPFLDTGLMIDDLAGIGRVYLAVSFLSDAIDIIGGLGPEGVAHLRAELTAAQERIAQLEAGMEGMVAANQALVKAGYPVEKPPLLPAQTDAAESLAEVEALEPVETAPRSRKS